MAGEDGRILIVDDHPRNVVILEKILAPRFRVASASSGGEALALFDHVTRTPLTAILGALDLAPDEETRGEQRSLLLMAREGAMRLNGTGRDLPCR